MKIGVFAVLFADRPLDEALDHLVSLGVQAVEIGTGAYPGNAHCNADHLLREESKLRAFREAIERHGIAISALSCHGNALHPQTSVARSHHIVFEQTVKLASKLGVERVITFSGCPGAGPEETKPSWIVSAWPPEFPEMLEWQWSERVIPYWREAARACKAANVKVAIEMHPNFVAYNPETMLRLIDVAPGTIGCNFDPSHMFWQGIDPVVAIRALGEHIYHVHAKDCRIDARNTALNGVLDVKKYTRELERSWLFRTVGWGSDALVWKDILSALRMVGYDHVISIEHEDGVMAPAEGLAKAISFLKEIVIAEPRGEAYWA